MKVYESGRESSLLADIKAGRKTIECRLNRDKFAKYKTGDRVWIREDIYDEGKIVESRPKQALVEILKVEQYKDFVTMLDSVDYIQAIPRAQSAKEALQELEKFYSRDEQLRCGVLAIYFKLIVTS